MPIAIRTIIIVIGLLAWTLAPDNGLAQDRGGYASSEPLTLSTPLSQFPGDSYSGDRFFPGDLFSPDRLRRLQGIDITTVGDLIDGDPRQLARALDMNPDQVRQLQQQLSRSVRGR